MRITGAAIAAVAAAPALVSALDLRLITYNIRQATNRPGKNEKHWNERRPLVTTQLNIEANEDTLMCFQEVFDHVLEDLKTDLGEKWDSVGVGRDDGKTRGEFSPILYRKDVWTVDSKKTYWLSPTPDRPSRGWDAGHNRIVTVAEFTHKDSGEQLAFLCTHFEWSGKKAQAESAKMMLDFIDGFGDKPVFVAGDLNSQPDEKPYQTMTQELTDFRTWAETYQSPLSRPHMETSLKSDADILTFTGFTEEEESMLLDYIFIKDKDMVSNPSYSVPTNLFDGVYSSDHRPVVVDVTIGEGF